MRIWNDNPFAVPPKLWQASFIAHDVLAEAAEWALAESTPALAVEHFVANEKDGLWRVQAIYDHKPDIAEIQTAVGVLEAMYNSKISALEIAEVPQKNWVMEVQTKYPPLRIGRHFIHGAHVLPPYPLGLHRLRVDAGMAFGTGEHATTAGCLVALARLHQMGVQPKRILDMGCGTGILALAAKQLWQKADVLGIDIDPVAVKVAKENAAINGLSTVRFLAANGYHSRAVIGQTFDLVIANILARPLMRMAKQAKAAMAPNAKLVLSGLLDEQSKMVRAAHQHQGLSLEHAHIERGWAALTLK